MSGLNGEEGILWAVPGRGGGLTSGTRGVGGARGEVL